MQLQLLDTEDEFWMRRDFYYMVCRLVWDDLLK